MFERLIDIIFPEPNGPHPDQTRFERAAAECPLPLIPDGGLPGGLEFMTGEYLTRVTRDRDTPDDLWITNRRIVWARNGSVHDLVTIDLADIVSVEASRSLFGPAHLTIALSSGRSVEGMPGGDAPQKLRDAVLTLAEYAARRRARFRRDPRETTSRAPAEAVRTDKYDRLAKLHTLYLAHAISDDEYEYEKARLLRQ